MVAYNSSTQFSSLKPFPASTLSWHSIKWCLAGVHSFEFSHSEEKKKGVGGGGSQLQPPSSNADKGGITNLRRYQDKAAQLAEREAC